MVRLSQRLVPAAVAACALSASCGDAALSLGTSPRLSRARADELFGALAARFGPLDRDRAFAERRPKLARAALVPSRAFKDASLWTSAEGAARRLEFAGRCGRSRYRMGVERRAPVPAVPADYRAVLSLRALAPGEYEWQASDELAVGTVTAADLDRALSAVLLAAERTGAAEARARGRADLPRTADALGRLFTLDGLEMAPRPGGGMAVTAVVGIRPAGIEKEFPRYARYIRKYLSPIRFHVVASDQEGMRWWEADGRDGRLTLRLRVRGGNLAPLEGSPRRMPDRLRVRADFSTRHGIFRVGLCGLDADVALLRAPREKAFTARFRQEPDWQLPFLIEPFLRASLRRPFAGEGALLGLAVREGEDQTLLVRDYRLAVKESWIVRWLGGLAGTAMDEFWRGAEEEADRFTGQALDALRQDVLSLASGGASLGDPGRGH